MRPDLRTEDAQPAKTKGGGKSIFINLIIIILVAVIGIWIVYFSLALFTKHGQKQVVPSVENMTYTKAIEKLHAAGFKIEIRDSLYREDVKPGYVIEQFPKAKSVAKPGRKVFLYINAVNPKQVVIDDSQGFGSDALKGYSLRQGLAKLQELGFKDIQIVRVLGDNDCIVKVLAGGRTVKKHQKVPVNSKIIVEVYDGRLSMLRDSLLNEERGQSGQQYFQSLEYNEETGEYEEAKPSSSGYSSPSSSSYRPSSGSSHSPAVPQTQPSEPVNEPDDEPDFIQ